MRKRVTGRCVRASRAPRRRGDRPRILTRDLGLAKLYAGAIVCVTINAMPNRDWSVHDMREEVARHGGRLTAPEVTAIFRAIADAGLADTLTTRPMVVRPRPPVGRPDRPDVGTARNATTHPAEPESAGRGDWVEDLSLADTLRQDLHADASRALFTTAAQFMERVEQAGLSWVITDVHVSPQIERFEVTRRDHGQLAVLQTIEEIECIAYGAPASTPRGAIVEILVESGCRWTPRDLERVLWERGIQCSTPSIRALLGRLVADGAIQRTGRGIYEASPR